MPMEKGKEKGTKEGRRTGAQKGKEGSKWIILCSQEVKAENGMQWGTGKGSFMLSFFLLTNVIAGKGTRQQEDAGQEAENLLYPVPLCEPALEMNAGSCCCRTSASFVAEGKRSTVDEAGQCRKRREGLRVMSAECCPGELAL